MVHKWSNQCIKVGWGLCQTFIVACSACIEHFVLCTVQVREVGKMRGNYSDFLFFSAELAFFLNVQLCMKHISALHPEDLTGDWMFLLSIVSRCNLLWHHFSYQILLCFCLNVKNVHSIAACYVLYHVVRTASSESYKPQPQRYRCAESCKLLWPSGLKGKFARPHLLSKSIIITKRKRKYNPQHIKWSL